MFYNSHPDNCPHKNKGSLYKRLDTREDLTRRVNLTVEDARNLCYRRVTEVMVLFVRDPIRLGKVRETRVMREIDVGKVKVDVRTHPGASLIVVTMLDGVSMFKAVLRVVEGMTQVIVILMIEVEVEMEDEATVEIEIMMEIVIEREVEVRVEVEIEKGEVIGIKAGIGDGEIERLLVGEGEMIALRNLQWQELRVRTDQWMRISRKR